MMKGCAVTPLKQVVCLGKNPSPAKDIDSKCNKALKKVVETPNQFKITSFSAKKKETTRP